jgi:anti-anti-sigma factor
MTAQGSSFYYEVEKSEIDESEVMDSRGNSVTTFQCHGRLVIDTRDQIEQMFKLNPFHGRIVIDLSDVSYVDSAGLGALIRLKMSAVVAGGVSVQFVQMTPRIMQLLKITNLTDWFTS